MMFGVVSLALIYYISVNTIFANTVLPNIWYGGSHLAFFDHSSPNILGLSNINVPGQIEIMVDDEPYNLDLQALGIEVVTDEKVVQYGKGSDFFKVISEGLSLVDGEEFNLELKYDSSNLFKQLGMEIYTRNSEEDTIYCNEGNMAINFNKTQVATIVLELVEQSRSNIYLGEFLDESSLANAYTCRNFTRQRLAINTATSQIYSDTYNIFNIWTDSDSNSYWTITNYEILNQILEGYRINNIIELREGQYQVIGNKAYLYEAYQVGKQLNVAQTISNIEGWLQDPNETLPLAFNEQQPQILANNYEIVDMTSNGMTTASILSVGDLMFHIEEVTGAYNSGTKSYDFNYMFNEVKPYISQADLAIGNFETVTYSKKAPAGFPKFNTPPSALDAIAKAGFDVLGTANNHSLDHGKGGVIETIQNIQKYGMQNVGSKINDDGGSIFIKDVNGIKVAILAYTYGLNGQGYHLSAYETTYMVNVINEDRIKRDVDIANKLGADVTVALLHWGPEYSRAQSPFQSNLAKKMTEWGVDIIFGSHPHVIQPAQKYSYQGQDKVIFYSLGNFVSNQRYNYDPARFKYTEDGVMAKVNISKNFRTGEVKITDTDYVPTWVNMYYSNGKLKYEILPAKANIGNYSLNATARNRVKQSYNNTVSILGNM